MTSSSKPRILLGVSGSVAAYKAVELAGLLKGFAEVRVVLTEAGSRLVPETSLRRASGHPVWRSLFKGSTPIPPGTPGGSHPLAVVPHIEYAKSADLVLVAPASADLLAKLALGIADDLLSTLCLYAPCPIWVAPAMNRRMWSHPAVRRNCGDLRKRGVRFLGPDSGHLACGEVGDGRFTEPSEIARVVRGHFRDARRWRGRRVIVTAGPTREPLDPVRYLTNRSSGRMGYALAGAALDRGASVTLVTGPTGLEPPDGARIVRVEDAAGMARETLRALPKADLVVMAAAVADYAPASPRASKIKKGTGGMTLRLKRNPDILGEILRRKKASQTVVGFAAETERLAANAARKWKGKPCDLLAANPVGKGRGFDEDRNELLVFMKGRPKPVHLRRDLKGRLAVKLLDLVDEYLRETSDTKSRRP